MSNFTSILEAGPTIPSRFKKSPKKLDGLSLHNITESSYKLKKLNKSKSHHSIEKKNPLNIESLVKENSITFRKKKTQPNISKPDQQRHLTTQTNYNRIFDEKNYIDQEQSINFTIDDL